MNWLLIGLGGALGAMARSGISVASTRLGFEKHFPFATLSANVLGCLLIGAAFAWIGRHVEEELARRLSAFVIAGFLGSLTTFSTFALQSRELSFSSLGLAALNIGLSVVLGLCAVWAGSALIARAG